MKRGWIAAILAAIGAGILLTQDTKKDPRALVVAAARGEMGKGDSAKYWAEVDPELEGTDAAWCGGFALWCLHQGGVALGIQWITGKGFLGRLKKIAVADAKPGDIAYYNKFSHHAVVAANNGDGTLDDINGNGTGGKVTETKRATPDAVYSIESVLPK